MALKIYTQPATEPISLEEAKRHLRIDLETTRDDDLVYGLIRAARQHCEKFQGRAYITQTWDLYLDSFPSTDYIELPWPPLQTVSQLYYKSTADVLTLWANTNYVVDTLIEPGRLTLAYGISWPDTLAETQAVQIRYVCGYGVAGAVPQLFKQAILLKLTDLYEHRGDMAGGELASVNLLDQAIEALLWPDRIVPL